MGSPTGRSLTVKTTPRLLASLLLALLVLVGCDPTDEAADAPTAAGGDIPAIVAEVEPSVVAIVSDAEMGSGVIYDSAGLIITNAHVVRDLPEVEVQLAAGQRMTGEVIHTDFQTDVALVEVPADDLPAVTFAEELPAVGELAVAIGNPLGLENTVTAGIISGLNRAVPAGPRTPQALVDLIQTDAPIAPGNSGGALVSAAGEVVGINVAYAPPQATGATAIGFAIPASTVTSVAQQLLETGEVRHSFLGVQPGPLSPQMVEQFDLAVDEGVLLLDVVPDSPAAQAGLESGDVLVELGGEPLRQVPELLGELRRRDPGDIVTLTVVRAGEEQEVDVTLAEQPDEF